MSTDEDSFAQDLQHPCPNGCGELSPCEYGRECVKCWYTDVSKGPCSFDPNGKLCECAAHPDQFEEYKKQCVYWHAQP